jgi:hypothetical protein
VRREEKDGGEGGAEPNHGVILPVRGDRRPAEPKSHELSRLFSVIYEAISSASI